MAWIILVVAGLFEIGWAIGLKYTNGFTRLVPTVLTAASMAISLGLLGVALKTLPVGTAYAVWTGIGAVGTAILGIYLLGMFTRRANATGALLGGILGTATGNVEFFDGTTSLGVRTLDNSGTASVTTATLPGGIRAIRVDYAGDGSFPPGSTILDPAQVVNRADSTTGLTVDPSSSMAQGRAAS